MSANTVDCVALMGPTAAGKTQMALMLSQRYAATAVSVDSVQVYRGLDLGTAKPGADELRQLPHRLIDLRDPWEPYSAGDFCVDAKAALVQIAAAGRLPLLVGGTGLYFRALLNGLAALPEADAGVRASLSQAADRQGWAALYQRLEQIDPDSAARIHPNDPQRIQRALEVHQITGRPLSVLQREKLPVWPLRPLKLIIAPADRALLHQRISARFDAMLAAGLVDEVRALRSNTRVHAQLPAMRAVGYRQVWQYLDGEVDYQEMRKRAIVATRQLAKRQLTWLRRESGALWIDPLQASAARQIDQAVTRFLRHSL